MANLNDGIPVECIFAFENLRLARWGASGVDRTQYLRLAQITSITSYSNPIISPSVLPILAQHPYHSYITTCRTPVWALLLRVHLSLAWLPRPGQCFDMTLPHLSIFTCKLYPALAVQNILFATCFYCPLHDQEVINKTWSRYVACYCLCLLYIST